MNEGDPMDVLLTKIKDLNEQLVSADEIIADSSLVQTVLDGLPDSYQSFCLYSQAHDEGKSKCS